MKTTYLRSPGSFLIAFGLVLVALTARVGVGWAFATRSLLNASKGSPLHPALALLDANAVNVLDSGATLSTTKTCGKCHDTNYIDKHNFHSDLGLADMRSGTKDSGQSWNNSRGAFGRWDPLAYRYLSQKDDPLLDLGTPEWVMLFGSRIAGGGPAVTSRDGSPLLSLAASTSNPETAVLDTATGKPKAWNWSESGVYETDCFICHIALPNNAARTSALKAGQFFAAGTASLVGTGIVTVDSQGVPTWNPAAFDSAGNLLPESLGIQDPTNSNCAQCHGLVQTRPDPVSISSCALDNAQTAVSGQLISPDRVSESGVNVSGKETLTRSWDIHAERGLKCTGCHYSLNNPAAYGESSQTRPAGLVFDPRRLTIGEYLKYPNHNIARGQSAQDASDAAPQGAMRRCEDCHDANQLHADWLPYTEKHMSAVACESCHVPALYAPAVQSYDWTVLTTDSSASSVCRGVQDGGGSNADLVTGFQPILLTRAEADGGNLVAPYNLVASWYWVYDDAHGQRRPVRLVDLQKTYFTDGTYASEIMKAFDYDADGQLSQGELRIDTPVKQNLVAGRLAALGLSNPRIEGLVQPHSINHDVTSGAFAIRDCRDCHGDGSRLAAPMRIADFVPGGVRPQFAADTNVKATGRLVRSDAALYYTPAPENEGLYIFGHSRYGWVDQLGLGFILVVLLGVGGHAGLRAVSSRRAGRSPVSEGERVYMYRAYERFWHWLQTALIVMLLFTGLIIHRPDLAGWLSFRGMVTVHNVSAALLALNAALSLFYHLTTGEIRQFIPRPYGFFDDAIVQAQYYLRGIFKRQPHPFEKSPDRKLNPLQQTTYFGILNVLLPLQMLTGLLMWGAQRWRALAAFVGGLPTSAGAHALVAWLFAGFIIAHVYLTTTGGPGPLDSLKAMILGWEARASKPVHDKKEKRK